MPVSPDEGSLFGGSIQKWFVIGCFCPLSPFAAHVLHFRSPRRRSCRRNVAWPVLPALWPLSRGALRLGGPGTRAEVRTAADGGSVPQSNSSNRRKAAPAPRAEDGNPGSGAQSGPDPPLARPGTFLQASALACATPASKAPRCAKQGAVRQRGAQQHEAGTGRAAGAEHRLVRVLRLR